MHHKIEYQAGIELTDVGTEGASLAKPDLAPGSRF